MSDFDDQDPFEGALSLSQQAMGQMRRAAPAGGGAYLEGLNPAQRRAVETLDGPVLMLAGAGTGKTRALTARIAHLIGTGRARPNEILAVTFTNKAAREMKDRVGQLLGASIEGLPWLGTFHSVCVKLLRRHAELIARDVGGRADALIESPHAVTLKPNFTILDTDDQIRLLKQLILAANMDEKRWPARSLAGLIDGWKNRALTPEKVPSSEAGAFNHRGSELYAQYQNRLITLNAVDFGDLLLHVVTIFQTHPDVLAQYQRWFRYILVDEYQDTNIAQYLWLRLLAQGHRNICCVGDDDQSIYGWRGAEVGNILRFEKDFPGAEVIRLEQNYRSTEHILAAASRLISGNQGRLGKTLWTEAKGGQKVRLIGHWDGEEEARWIGEEIEALRRGTHGLAPMRLEDQAILVRASHQMRAFEDRFLSIGLPYRVIGGPRFYERLEIRDAMAYFRLAVSPDDDLAFERVVNMPKRGLGEKAQQTIQRTAREGGTGLVLGARAAVVQGALPGRAGGQLRGFVEGIGRWHAAVLDGEDHVRLAETILEDSGYTAMWLADKTPEAPGRLENLKELVKALEQFENLQGFLEHVALIMDNDRGETEDKVSIMTLHAAKGLEFPAVFLPGWEDGLFPSQRALDEGGQKSLEEERRLAYVGITRAERLCTISFAGNRRVYGQWQSQMPSRFIDELPAANVDILTAPGLYGGGGSFGGSFGSGFGGAGHEAARTSTMSGIEERATRADVYNSPGWRRMQARGASAAGGGTGSPVTGNVPAAHRRVVTIDAEALPFALGDRVFHLKFGYGEVTGAEQDTMIVDFEKAGSKHVKAAYLKPADAADDVPF